MSPPRHALGANMRTTKQCVQQHIGYELHKNTFEKLDKLHEAAFVVKHGVAGCC